MTTDPVSRHDFKQHVDESDRNFAAINARLDENQDERARQHEEVMKKLGPLYDTFMFKDKLSKVGMKWLVTTTKVLGFLLAVAAFVKILWLIIIFGVNHSK